MSDYANDLFDNAYITEPNSGCWIWLKGQSQGYGMLYPVKGARRGTKASRFSYERFKGPIPPNLWVLHKCNTRSCVNPDHLYIGTVRDNTLDIIRHNRQKRKHRNRKKLWVSEIFSKKPT